MRPRVCLSLPHVCTQKVKQTGTISIVVAFKQQGIFIEVKNFSTVASEAEADVFSEEGQTVD